MRIRLSSLLPFLPVLIVVASFGVAERLGSEQAKLLAQFVGLFVASLSAIPTVQRSIEDRKVKYLFSAKDHQKRGFLWIANLGKPVFTVTRVRIRTLESEQGLEASLTLKEGEQHEIDITEILLRVVKESLWDDIEIAFDFSSAHGSGSSEAQPFHVMAPYGSMDRISARFEMPLHFKCPKCGQPAFIRVRDLNRLHQLADRKRKAEKDFKLSCPAHKSEWLAKIESQNRTKN
jgi:hypothetical protein